MIAISSIKKNPRKEELNVFLIRHPHPVYKSLVDYPPTSVNYVNIPSKKSDREIKSHYSNSLVYKVYKKIGVNLFRSFRIPKSIYLPKTNESDIIHSPVGTLILNRKNWVVDVDIVDSFVHYEYIDLYNEYYRKLILKLLKTEYCKKIICWSNFCKNSILDVFPELNKPSNLYQKLTVLYPASPPMLNKTSKTRREKSESLTLLFIGKHFYWKGGREVLQAFEKVSEKYDVKLIVRSEVPRDYIKKFDKRKDVKIISNNINYSKIKSLYLNSDIFIFPSYKDIFGYVLLEAMSCGLPIIATNIGAIPEVVRNNYNGFLLNPPINGFTWRKHNPSLKVDFSNVVARQSFPKFVEDLSEKISTLIEEDALRKVFSKNSLKLVREGPFSISERNNKLREIYYESAL